MTAAGTMSGAADAPADTAAAAAWGSRHCPTPRRRTKRRDRSDSSDKDRRTDARDASPSERRNGRSRERYSVRKSMSRARSRSRPRNRHGSRIDSEHDEQCQKRRRTERSPEREEEEHEAKRNRRNFPYYIILTRGWVLGWTSWNIKFAGSPRYIAVTQPIKYAKHKNNKRVWFTIVLVWLVSAAIGAPIVLGLNDTADRNFQECLFNNQNYVLYSSLGSFYIPCIMMMFLYYNIFKALRNRAKKQRAAKKPPVSDTITGATTAVVIENVAHTRQLETALDDRPTNTGSGSNEDDHEDSFDKRSMDLEADADECHVIPNNKSTEFMLTSVTDDKIKAPKKNIKKQAMPDPNGNNDSGYAPSNLEDTIREHVSPPGSPGLKNTTVLKNMSCETRWKKNGKRIDTDSRNASIAFRSDDDLRSSHYDIRDGSTCKKERKASAATARFTIYKANKASKKKREKSSAKKERKATKTLAIVLGVFLFCWTPFFTCNVLDAISGKFGLQFTPGVTVFILNTWLGYINSFLNPVIYTIFNPEFRKAFRKILKCST